MINIIYNIWEFVINTLTGNESVFYKVYNKEIELNTNNAIINSLCNVVIVNYINGYYKTLILENDDYIVTIFNNMRGSHSKNCIIIFLGVAMSNLHLSLQRENFNTLSYDKYIKSVRVELNNKSPRFLISLVRLLSHKCGGKDLPFYTK